MITDWKDFLRSDIKDSIVSVTAMGSYSIAYQIGEAPNKIHVCKEKYAELYGVGKSTIDVLISDIKKNIKESLKPFSDSTRAATTADIINAANIGYYFYFFPFDTNKIFVEIL